MGAIKRVKTKYPGVYYRVVNRIGGAGKEKVYYVVFKQNGKVIEESVGRQFKDAMTPAKASVVRAKLIEGKQETKRERRAEKARKVWNVEALWAEYKELKTVNKALETDDGRYWNYIHNQIGKKVSIELVPLDIERIRIGMQKSGKSPQTIKHVLALVKRIVNFGVDHGLCSGMNFKIKMPEVDNRVTEDLTPGQLASLLQAINEDSNKAAGKMMLLALFTGMRKTEMFKLQWRDINYHRGFILIRDPKGGKSQEIPLNERSRMLLKDWLKTPGSPFVFPGKDGSQRKTMAVPARRIRERAGLPKSFRPLHGLRHVYASMLASSGQVDMYTLQKLLTHKSPVMTQRYAHLRDEAMAKAANLAGDIIGQAIESGAMEENQG